MNPDNLIAEHAERAILGSVLIHGDRLPEVALEASDFGLDSHRIIFAAMQEIRGAGTAIDMVTMVERLKGEQIGGLAYLFSLTEGLPFHLAIGSYVAIVKEKSRLRGIVGACEAAVARVEDDPSTDIARELWKALKAIMKPSDNPHQQSNHGNQKNKANDSAAVAVGRAAPCLAARPPAAAAKHQK